MRTYLIVLIAFALIVSYGCGGKDSAGLTPDEAAKLARNGGGSGGGSGIAGNNSSMDSSQGADQNSSSDQSDDNSDEDSKADEASDEDAEDSTDDAADSDSDSSDAGDDDAKDDEPATRANTPAPPRRSAARRRRRVQNPTLSGGGAAADQRREEEARKKQAARDARNNNDNTASSGSSQPPADAVEADEPVEKFVSLYDRAVTAFSKNHDTEGFQYLYGHYLIDKDALSTWPLGWYEGISEPRIALRWGIAVDYNDGGYDGDPPVIGDPIADESDNSGNNRRGGSNSDFGAPGGGGMGISGGRSRRNSASGRPRGGNNNSRGSSAVIRSPDESLEHYTGDFGEQFVSRYEMRRRHDDAFYGLVMKEIDTKLAEETEEEEEAPEETPRRRSSGSSDFGTLGGGGGIDMERQRRERQNRTGGRNGGGSDDDGYVAEESSIAPGLMFVGVGNKNEMLSNARKLNLDLLAMFEVKVKHTERRNGDTSTKSNTRLVVYSVKTGEALDTNSKSLSNLAVDSARKNNREDPVELELDKVFGEMADKVFKSGDLPSLTADIVVKRYEYLLKKEYDNPLPVLVEIKHYLDAGHISQNDYIAACEQLLGEVEAQDLIDGDNKKKVAALSAYLPGEYEVDTSVSNDEEFR